MDPSQLGKALLVVGLGLALLGGALLFLGKIPFLGKLPGDIRVEREGFGFYFPVVTCLLASAVLTLIFWIISRFK